MDNLDLDLLQPENQIQPKTLVTFDSSKGLITINSDSPLSTQNLNQESFYNLLLRLQQNNQLELDNQSLTSQFYLSQEELNKLIVNPAPIADAFSSTLSNTNFELDQNYLDPTPIVQNYSIDPLQSTDAFQMNHPQPKANLPKCQELCCLLKFNASDDLINLI